MAASSTAVEVGGRSLTLSNLDKVLYPSGFTKAQVIDYYARVAPFALGHLANRALTFKRFPNGSDTTGFFEKRCPKHRPPWLEVAQGPGDHNGTIDYCRIDEPASLVWAANMAALELHAPMAHADDVDTPASVVFDFDPGVPAAIRECCEVALGVQEILAAVDLAGWCKTSGSKGLQMYVPLNSPATHEAAGEFALAVGQLLEKQRPRQVTTTMAKSERPGKVFVDWSQNTRHKTTIAPYSLRARPEPTVSTPVSWDEVSDCASGAIDPLRFEAPDVLARVATLGDLFEPVLSEVQQLPGRGG